MRKYFFRKDTRWFHLDKKNVYGGFSQALFFSGTVSIPRFLLDHYVEIGISEREMLLIIHFLAESNNRSEDIFANIIDRMGISQQEFTSVVQSLKKKNLLTINDPKKNETNRFDLSGMIDQLFELWGIYQFKQMEASDNNLDSQKTSISTDNSLPKITTLFENELGRPLTGLECEHIEKWLGASYSEELIIEALRRGVSAGIRSFRYLDTILREWEKKGIKTRMEVEAEDQHFQSRQQKKTEKQKKTSTPKNKYDDIYL